MGRFEGEIARRAALAAGLVLALSAGSTVPAFAEEYPRRIAIAPFASLARDDIAHTVAIVPRLLSSRLMAMAGAEVLLLPGEAKDPAAAARAAGMPLLLQGTVARLGRGYSIDVSVTDLAGAKTAGAFFAAAATEDEIIPQLGVLAAEIAEKIFGVRAAPRAAVAPGPAQTPPAAAAALTAPGNAGVGATAAEPAPGTPGPAPGGTQEGGRAGAVPPLRPQSLEEGWVPAAIKKVSQSDRIPDEIFGVVAGDAVDAGTVEVIAHGRRTIYVYRVKGDQIVPFTRVTRPMNHHLLNVESFDVDGDGRKDLLVTEVVNDSVESFVLRRTEDRFETVQEKIPYLLVVLPDWEGKPLIVGQRRGVDAPFAGRFYRMVWSGTSLKEGEPLPARTEISPLSAGVLGLSSARFGSEWRYVYLDDMDRLRIVAPDGKSEYRSREKFGSPGDYLEWGEVDRLAGRRPRYYLRDAPRVVPGAGGRPFVLVPVVKRGVVDTAFGSYDSSRLVLLQWDGGAFVERASTSASDHYYSGADFLPPKGAGRIVCAVIEQEAGFMKQPASRLHLLALQ